MAQIEGAPAGVLSARLQVTDSLDRLLFDAPAVIRNGRAEWTYPNRDPLAVVHSVEVRVMLDGKPYLAAREDLYVPRFTWDDYPNMLWPAEEPAYAIDRRHRRIREDMGVDFFLCGGCGGTLRELNRLSVASGARPFYTNVASQIPVETERNPEMVRQRVHEEVEAACDEIRRNGACAVMFCDERHEMDDSQKATPEALRKFRVWLRGRYTDIGALNRAWGRSFASFDDVMPTLTKEYDPAKETSFAPWLEWRLWAVHEVVEIDRANVKLLRQRIGRDMPMGGEGIFDISSYLMPYGGYDFPAQSRDCFNTMWPYSHDMMNLCWTFFPGPSVSWSGYGFPYPAYERWIWEGAMQGRSGMGWFNGRTFYHPFDWYYPQARWVRDLTRPLREGIGKLLIENQPIQTEPIAFLYSQPSLYMMGIIGKTLDPTNPQMLLNTSIQRTRQSLQKMFLDAGVQFGWVSEQDLQEGNSRGAKLLILSSCVALAPETCKALEKFVASGGIVVADLAPGVWDDHGSPHQPGQLDELFGVKRDGKFQLKAMPSDWGVGTFENEPDFIIRDQWFIGQYYEKTLKVADGRALGRHIFGPKEDQAPAFIFKRHGKGVAILTNYLESEYRRVADRWQKVLVKALLQLAGIRPQVVLRDMVAGGTPIDDGVIVSRWEDGPAEYFGVLLERGRRTRVELPREGYLYELVRGQSLGHGKQVDLDLRDHAYAIVAVMPRQVGDLKIRGGRAKRGESLPLRLSLASGGLTVKHVVHLTVLRPDEKNYYGLTRNVVIRNGDWNGALPLALNDPAGIWRITAREVVSGAISEVAVEVAK